MTRFCRAALSFVLALLAGACAAPLQRLETPVLFPPAPELPRIQYLTSFSGRKDIEKQSGFDRFVVGETPDVKLVKPYGVAMHAGKIYVCDSTGAVVVFDLVRKTFGPMKGAVGEGRLVQPINISIAPDGTKYVADSLRGQVVVFGADDRYVKALGAPGSWRPVDAIPFGEKVLVADVAGGAVKVFDKATGELVGTIGDKGEPAARLDRPTNLAVDGEGNLFVTDVGRLQVLRFDREGRFTGTIGKAGDNLGHFARPKGLAIDRQNRLYVVDASFSNVQVFTGEGRLLMFFGGSGPEPGHLLLPAKVAIDYDNLSYFTKYFQPEFAPEYLLFVTSQFGDRRLSVFAYGREKGKAYPSDAQLLQQIEKRRQEELEKEKPAAP